MGIIYGEQGRLDEAISAFEKTLEMDPTDLESHDKLALAYLLKGRIAEAERILKYLLAVDDENSQAHNNMGWIALKKKDTREARRHFERPAVGSGPAGSLSESRCYLQRGRRLCPRACQS